MFSCTFYFIYFRGIFNYVDSNLTLIVCSTSSRYENYAKKFKYTTYDDKIMVFSSVCACVCVCVRFIFKITSQIIK